MFDINRCYDSFATEPNTAHFWSGLGAHGADIAAEIAQSNNGVTLEMVMDKNKDAIIDAGFPYNEDLGGFYFTRDTANDWEIASSAYAEQASGTVRAVLGDNVHEGSVWKTKELPALSENKNINKITAVDPTTGQDKSVLLDKTSGSGESSQVAPVTAVDTAQNTANNKEPKGKVDTNTTDGFYNAKVPPSNNLSSTNQSIGKSNNGFNM